MDKSSTPQIFKTEGRNMQLMLLLIYALCALVTIFECKKTEANETLTLRYEMVPSFGVQSSPPAERTYAIVGGKAEIHCVPSGVPKPSVEWVIISNNKNYIIQNNERFTILPSGTLKIINIRKSDQGTYNCVASNKLGTTSKGAELFVTGGLAITHDLTRRDTITSGEKILLSCIISNPDDMEVTFSWKLGNRVLGNNGRTRIYRTGPKQSNLEIKNAVKRDTGYYKCEVDGTKDISDTKGQYITVSGKSSLTPQTTESYQNENNTDEEELVVYPYDVKLHTMSSTYLLLSFKIRFHGEILHFDLATSNNASNCEMNGYVLYSNYLKAVQLSVCDGIAGVVELGGSKFLNFLPILEDESVISINNLSKTQHVLQITDSTGIGMVVDKNESVRRKRGWGSSTLIMLNKSGRYVLIYYMTNGHRRYHTRLRVNEKIAIVSYVSTTWYAYDRKEQAMLMNNRFQFFVHPSYRNKEVNINVHAKIRYTTAMRLKNLPQMRERYMEVVVIGDATFLNFYQTVQNAERYVKSLMNSVNRIYRDKSLDTTLHIVLRKVVFERSWNRLKIPRNNAKKALRTACKYVFDWKKQYGETFDFGVILTKTRFGVSGYAPVYRMCVEYKSCTLVSDSGFNSAFIIAHEMAHSVGVLHDGDNNRCKGSAGAGSVMSPTIYSTYFRYHWSNCSKITMRENLRYFNCLNDKPSYYRFDTQDLPGTKFNLDQQCRFRMGKGHTACLGRREPEQYCRYMFCRRPRSRTPGKITCTYWSLAPPDGTICAKGMWCVAGKCLPKGLLSPSPINGGWSEWSAWGPCKGKCGKGVQFRQRECRKPRPAFGGKECGINWQEWRICDKGACTVNKVFQDDRLEQCFKLGRGWDWLPNNNIIENMNDVNLNCTFENGSCNWEMGKDKQKSFTFGTGETPTKDTGPYYDHTFSNKSGGYIYLESSYPRRRNDKVEINSRSLLIYKSCLRFYYFMMGEKVGSLRVFADYGDMRKQLWNQTGDKGDQWLHAELLLQEEKQFKIVIESSVGNNYLSDIAVDDISVTDGNCKNAYLNPCKITCIHGDNRILKYNHEISDGMKCYEDREDMCVNGRCEYIGCDGKKDSKLTFDKCGVCGGGGASCKLVKVILRITPTHLQDTFIKIPVGSTHVRIEKNGTHTGHIAVRSSKDIYYYQEIPPFYPWYYFKMAGSTFRYHIFKDKTQIIYADGPTTRGVDVEMVFRDYSFKKSPPIDINITYYVKSDTKRNIYAWKLNEVTNCTAVCGGGNYSILFGCVNMKSYEVVDRTKCSPEYVSPKETVKPCNTQPCKTSYEYRTGPWGSCNSCNKMGLRIRNVSCIHLQEGGSPQPVDISLCANLKKPVAKKSCYLYCPYANKKCSERSRRCPEMLQKGYCRYRSVQLLCCKTCSPFFSISPGSYIIV